MHYCSYFTTHTTISITTIINIVKTIVLTTAIDIPATEIYIWLKFTLIFVWIYYKSKTILH